jgi:PAS domain S-box-containing protein
MNSASQDYDRFAVQRIVGIYAIVGGLWIYFSDTILGWLVRDPAIMTYIAISKGILFIIITSSLLYLLIHRHMNRLMGINRMLQERELLLQSIATNIPGVICQIYALDAKAYRVTYVSERIKEIFGLSTDLDTFFPSFTAHVVEEDRVGFLESIREAVSASLPWRFEGRFIKQEGELLWFQVMSTPQREKEHLLYHCVLLDITERKRVEEALRESEANYRQLFDNAPTAIYKIDFGTGKFLKANDVVCEYLDCSQEEIVSRSPYDIMTDESKQLLTERLNKMMLGEKVTENPEYEIIDKKGKCRWLQLHSKNFYNAEGLVIGADVVAHDITERKQVTEKLLESEERYRALFDHAPLSYQSLDGEGHFIEVNQAWLDTLGYNRGEVIGKWFGDFLAPEFIDPFRERFPLFKALGKIHSEFKMLHKNGSIRFIAFEGRIAYGPDMSFKQTHCLLSDITDHKLVEEEKRRLEERLQRSEKMEALGQMAGGVAHDLNNVLGILSGYSELLLAQIPEGHRSRGHIEKILQSTEKGAAIIQDLLTLARRGVMVSDVVNLNSIVSAFLMTPVFEKIKDDHPRVTFRMDCDQNLLSIKGSPIHLEKTLMNLVLNAAEAISGLGEVTVRTESRYLDKPIGGYDDVKEGDYAVLTVSDTGMGIPHESIKKIFEPFYTKKMMGRSGTGLGLAIVWGTVKDHNGYIDVQTEVGQGTTFTLYFPVSREELIIQQQRVQIERYMGKGESVLVVDDIAEQRDVASLLLAQLGYQVNMVSGGEEAVEYLKRNNADILVLDMIMTPGIDGLETYQRVLEINPKQKAILVSGFSETERVKEAQRLGAGAYVKKPYVMEKIGVAIRQELCRK